MKKKIYAKTITVLSSFLLMFAPIALSKACLCLWGEPEIPESLK